MDVPVAGPVILGSRHLIVKINATIEFICLCENPNGTGIFQIPSHASQKTTAKLVQWRKNNASINLQVYIIF